MKNSILKYTLLPYSIVLFYSSCTDFTKNEKKTSSLDSVFAVAGSTKNHRIFICLSAYDCVSCYKPVYEAVKTFRCGNAVFLSSSLRQAEEEQFANSLKSKTQLEDFSFTENTALVHEIYKRAGLRGPNSIAVINRKGRVLFSSALKSLSEADRKKLKEKYCE